MQTLQWAGFLISDKLRLESSISIELLRYLRIQPGNCGRNPTQHMTPAWPLSSLTLAVLAPLPSPTLCAAHSRRFIS